MPSAITSVASFNLVKAMCFTVLFFSSSTCSMPDPYCNRNSCWLLKLHLFDLNRAVDHRWPVPRICEASVLNMFSAIVSIYFVFFCDQGLN